MHLSISTLYIIDNIINFSVQKWNYLFKFHLDFMKHRYFIELIILHILYSYKKNVRCVTSDNL